MTTADARELALREVGHDPGIQQRELAERLHELTGLAESTLVKLFRRLERDGELEAGVDGRRKTYQLPDSNGAVAGEQLQALVDALAPNGHAAPAAAPVPAPQASGIKRGSGLLLAGIVVPVLLVALAAALFLAPEKQPTLAELPSVAEPAAKPAAEPTVEPAARADRPSNVEAPRRQPAPGGADLRRARRLETAVMSGVGIPGIATRTAARLARQGFKVAPPYNAAGPSERSLVLYARGARGPARALARKLRVRTVARLTGPNAAIAPSAKLVVVLGADRRR